MPVYNSLVFRMPRVRGDTLIVAKLNSVMTRCKHIAKGYIFNATKVIVKPCVLFCFIRLYCKLDNWIKIWLLFQILKDAFIFGKLIYFHNVWQRLTNHIIMIRMSISRCVRVTMSYRGHSSISLKGLLVCHLYYCQHYCHVWYCNTFLILVLLVIREHVFMYVTIRFQGHKYQGCSMLASLRILNLYIYHLSNRSVLILYLTTKTKFNLLQTTSVWIFKSSIYEITDDMLVVTINIKHCAWPYTL